MRQGKGNKQPKPLLFRTSFPGPALVASPGNLLEMQSLTPQAC